MNPLLPVERKKLRKVTTSQIKVLEGTDDIAHWLVLVTPWGGDQAKAASINGVVYERDLGGDYFYQGYTDFADEHVTTLKGFYEHSINAMVNPYMVEDTQYLGPAHLKVVDEWGRWFDFEIDRTKPYYDYLEQLKTLNLLGASTQAYFGGVTREEDGRLKRWWESEVSLTPTPLHPGTIAQVYELAKSCNMPFDIEGYKTLIKSFKKGRNMMGKPIDVKKNKKSGDDVNPELPEAQIPESDVPIPEGELDVDTPEGNSDEDGVGGMAGDIKAMFEVVKSAEDDDGDDSVTFDLEELEGKSASELLKIAIAQSLETQQEIKTLHSSVSAYVDLWGNLGDLKELLAVMQSIESVTTQSLKVANVTQQGVTQFAESVATRLKAVVVEEVGDELRKSDREKELEDESFNGTNKKTNHRYAPNFAGLDFPDNAPGGN